MISLIRRALDARRLTAELEAAETEIVSLKTRLANSLSGPLFQEVAKDFDATHFHDHLMNRVVEDLAPMLERDVLSLLKAGMKSLAEEARHSPRMAGSVAYDTVARVSVFEFRVAAMGTTIKVANL